MVDVTACLGDGWHFDGSGKPALLVESGGPFYFDGSGHVLLKMDGKNTNLNGSGEITDKTHLLNGTGGGSFSSAAAYGVSPTIAAGGGSFTMAGAQSWGTITNTLSSSTAPGLLTLWANSDMGLTFQPADATGRATMTLEVYSGGADAWMPVHQVITDHYFSGSDKGSSSSTITKPWMFAMSAGQTITPTFRIRYDSITGGHAYWGYATEVSYQWQLHRT